MKKYLLLLLLLGSWGTSLFATPLSFTDSRYQAGATALAGSATDSNSAVSPPSALLVSAATSTNFSSASSAGATDIGFLGTAIDVAGNLEEVSGVGNAEFKGEFIAPGAPILISIQFESQSDISGDGFAEGQLILSLIINGIPLPPETFTVPGVIERVFNLPAGADSLLELFLTSTGTATNGTAFNQVTAAFNVSVPEAPMAAIFLTGLALMLSLQRRWRPVAGKALGC